MRTAIGGVVIDGVEQSYSLGGCGKAGKTKEENQNQNEAGIRAVHLPLESPLRRKRSLSSSR